MITGGFAASVGATGVVKPNFDARIGGKVRSLFQQPIAREAPEELPDLLELAPGSRDAEIIVRLVDLE